MPVSCSLFQAPVAKNLSLRQTASYTHINDEEVFDSDLTFKELTSILEKNRFSKIDQLLGYLKVNKPDYMSRYTLVHRSMSLHESSKENPRALVFGKGAGTIITFNGSPSQANYEMLEVQNFNNETKKFEYREIEFNERGQLGALPYRISANGGPANKCMACHREGQPLWRSYATWPGVYGAEDDVPIFSGNSKAFADFQPGISKQLKNDWNYFKKNHLSKGRYRNLNPPAHALIADGYDKQPRPNTDLTSRLTRMNFKRIARMVKEAVGDHKPNQSLYEYAVNCRAENQILASTPISDTSAQLLSSTAAYFELRARNKIKEIILEDVKALAKDFGMNWKVIEKNLNNPGRDVYYEEWTKSQSPNENVFFDKVVREFHNDPDYGTKTFKDYPREDGEVFHSFLMAILEKYLPAAKVRTWPMNFREVYLFDDGLNPATDFEYALALQGPEYSSQTNWGSISEQERLKACQGLLRQIEKNFMKN